ncbi:MAG: DUF2269 family protein [Candidatus Promineifilaceae bacterium]
MSRTLIYNGLQFIHVLMAIVAVGFNASYPIWLARAGRQPEHLSHVLRGIKTLDDRFANPAYGLLLLTGLGMVWAGRLPLSTFWIAAALGLYLVAILLGLLVYSPALRRQIEALESQGPQSAAFQAASGRARTSGIVLSLVVVAIVFLMVVKPAPG